MAGRESKKTDQELLKDYVNEKSEAAFTELMCRYASLVYTTCRREIGDTQLAEEGVSLVFLTLARKAHQLQGYSHLTGWLFETARRQARTQRRGLLRQEIRQSKVEKQWQEDLKATDERTRASLWDALQPELNQALSALPAADREAVLLRYFQGLSLAEVGQSLGVSPDAARMRVQRGLEKMRKHFGRVGIVLSTSLLADLLESKAAETAPVALVSSLLNLSLLTGEKTMWIYALPKFVVPTVMGLGLLSPLALTAVKKHQDSAPETPKAQGKPAPLLPTALLGRLPSDFSLVYKGVSRTTKYFTTSDKFWKPEQEIPVTVSVGGQGGKLRTCYQIEGEEGRGGITSTVGIFDGTQTQSAYLKGDGTVSSVGNAVKVEPGFSASHMQSLPVFCEGIPGTAFIQNIVPAPEKGPGIYRAQVIYPGLIVGSEYARAQIKTSLQSGRRVVEQVVLFTSYPKKAHEWNFRNFRWFEGVAVPQQITEVAYWDDEKPIITTTLRLESISRRPPAAQEFTLPKP